MPITEKQTVCVNSGFAHPADTTKQVTFDLAGLAANTQASIIFGSGAPSATAAKGSVYFRTDGSSSSTRMYINTDGAATWTNVTTAA